ncbi:helix-turn-helix domain-containing protein [Nocardiopsis synnemataformans]|uniref:helix-turn-helix domain-containing protein n=1 Tax=Nocardiopsis synnemataformans TaxID=61305 RepID=UPI003EB6F6C8
MKSPVTLGEIGSLPLLLDPVTAGRVLGMSRSSTYRHLQAGTFPVPAHRVGRSWHIPTAGILAHLGIGLDALLGCCGCGARHDEHQEANHGRA